MFGNFTSQIKVFVWMSSNIGLEPFQVHLACAYMQHSTFTFTFFCTSDHCMHPRSTCNIYFYLFFFTLDIWPVHAATCNSNFPNNLTQCPVQCSALSSSPTHQFHCFLRMKIPCTSYLYSSCSGALIRNDCHTLIALLSASQSLHLHWLFSGKGAMHWLLCNRAL